MSETITLELGRAIKAAEMVRTSTALRDRCILEAVAGGLSQREVARAVGLSHTAVQQIVRRAAEEAS